MQTILWQPTTDFIKSSNMFKFMEYVNNKTNANFSNYSTLYNWSITEPKIFWEILANFCNIKFSKQHNNVLSNDNDMLRAKWFEGAQLNFAENLLTKRDQSIAVVYCNENMQKSSLTYAELFIAVASFAKALLARGIQPKDRIVGLISNTPEALIAMLATSSIGAIWSSCSPDFGSEAIVNRFQQISPKLLLTQLKYQYNGKIYDIKNKLEEIIKTIPSIKTVVVLEHKEHTLQINSELLAYRNFLSPTDHIEFYHGDFDHPLYILYSSGTTGKPKCIVHGSGGTLLQHSKELILHTNISSNDTIFYYSSVGWMMWNWLISSLKIGSTIVLYDGSPMFKKNDILFDLIDQEKISIFGTSAKYLAILEQRKINPIKTHSLESLKTILSTGSPLSEHSFEYVYHSIKQNICLSSISGGSDIISCFGIGNPMKPVIKGELQCIGLGMNVKIFDENAKSIQNKLGELVCTKPFPSRPIYFWHDHDFALYKKSYYAKFKNVWRHGDYAMLTSNAGLKITGRSDTTLNPGGIRIGTAEIYQLLENIPFIFDSIIIGKDIDGDVELILFIVISPQEKLTENLTAIIKNKITYSLSTKYLPNRIIQVADVPRTFNDKKAEIAIKNIFNNIDVTNLEALINPDSLNEYRKIYNDLFN